MSAVDNGIGGGLSHTSKVPWRCTSARALPVATEAVMRDAITDVQFRGSGPVIVVDASTAPLVRPDLKSPKPSSHLREQLFVDRTRPVKPNGGYAIVGVGELIKRDTGKVKIEGFDLRLR